MLLATACARAEPQATRFVGAIEGTGAMIAVVSSGDALTAYACDGKQMSEWFRGRPTTGRMELASRQGVKLSVSIGRTAAIGIVTVAGERRRFTAAAARKPVLFRAEATSDGLALLVGWIVAENGVQRGNVERRGPDGARAVDPAPPLADVVRVGDVELRPRALEP